MNILYGIQGTGHGHISRAKELLPELSNHAEVDVLVSGYNCKLNLDSPVRYRKHGISMTYDSNGGVSILETLRSLRPIRFITDIQSIPIGEYDLVVSDYEPVTAWAARTEQIPCVALSHQAAFLSQQTPRPRKRSAVAEAILQHFAPADHAIGFHFRSYDWFIEPPIIRSEITELSPTRDNHITVYLPAYHHELLASIFHQFDHYKWHIFSPEADKFEQNKNVLIHPVSNREFLESFESCSGVVTSSGFEMCAESMYLGKKLLTVPIRNQYEQLCNAAAMEQLGITQLTTIRDRDEAIGQWLEAGQVVTLSKAANISRMIPKILSVAKAGPGSSNILLAGEENKVAV